MESFMFDRLDYLLKANGTTRKALCKETGHADNYIRMFEKRGTEPPRAFVNFCAEKLGTTSAYLYGETDDPSPMQKEKPAAQGNGLEEKFSGLLDKMSQDEQANVLKYMEFVLSNRDSGNQ